MLKSIFIVLLIFSACSFRYFYFGFSFVSTELQIRKETLVYPSMSFISEFGGSLGLFVGFSFLTAWDFFNFLFEESKFVKNYL